MGLDEHADACVLVALGAVAVYVAVRLATSLVSYTRSV